MARPRGLRLHKPSLDLYCSARRLSLTDAAESFGIPFTSLYGLAVGDHRASMSTVRQIEERAGTEVVEALFPELGGVFSERTVAAA